MQRNSKCKKNIKFMHFSKLRAGIGHRFWAGLFAFRFPFETKSFLGAFANLRKGTLSFDIFDVFLTMHHTIGFFQVTNLMHNSFIL